MAFLLVTNRQVKRRSRTFSLTNEEMASLLEGAARHGYGDRNEYLLALVEADIGIPLAPALDGHRKVLRPAKSSELAKALAKLTPAGRGTSQPFRSRA